MSVNILVETGEIGAYRAENGGFKFDPNAWIEMAYPMRERRTMDLDGKPTKYEAQFTAEGLAAMVEKFRSAKAADPNFSLLVNIDHLALQMDQKTEAAAWIEDLVLGDDGHLWAKFRWSSLGEELARGGVYRFVSVEVESDGTPRSEWAAKGVVWDRLVGAAVTNDHALKKLRPFCCRAENEIEKKNNPKGPNMENLKKMLGLAPEATEADVEAAVKALQDAVAAGQAEKAETEMRTKEDAFVKKCGAKFRDEDAAKAFFRALPEKAEEIVETFKAVEKPAEPPAVSHRNGGTPGEQEDASPAGLYRKWSEMPEGQEKDRFLSRNAEAINAGASS